MSDQFELNRPHFEIPSVQGKRKGARVRTWLVASKLGVSLVEELGKQAIMRRTGITARDLRVVEPELSYPSVILQRERAIVVNLEYIKAIITADEILVPNPRDPCIATFVRDLELQLSDFTATAESCQALEPPTTDDSPKTPLQMSKRGNSKPLHFEFRALEICLESLCRSFESETSTLEKEAYPALDELSAKTSTLILKRVKGIKGRLVSLSGRVQKVRDEFEHLLDDDMDMAEMYLTDKLSHFQPEDMIPEDDLGDDSQSLKLVDNSENCTERDVKPNVEEMEMLFGAYFVQIESTLNKLSTDYIHDTEDYINIVMDDKQNQLLRMGVIISTATLMLNAGIVASGLLSMNVRIALFDNGTYPQWYEAVGGISGACIVLYAIAITWFQRKRLLG